MKLNETTLEVLKNFSNINTALVINAGKFQKTIDSNQSIMAEATIEDDIPYDAPIYDLPQFLGLLSKMGNPDLNFIQENRTIQMSDGELNLVWRLTNPDLISVPPEDKIEINDPDTKFVILEKQLKKLTDIASMLGLPELIVEGGPNGVQVKIDDRSNDSSHTGTIKISDEPVKEFTAAWAIENLKMLPGNYNVTVSADGLSIFENDNQTRKYYISLQV